MKKIFYLIITLLWSSSLFSQTAEEYFNNGSKKFDLKNYQGAIEDFSKAINIEPHVDDYVGRASAKYALKDYEAVLKDCNIALEIDPKIALIYSLMGLSKIQLGMIERGCLDLHAAKLLGDAGADIGLNKYCK